MRIEAYQRGRLLSHQEHTTDIDEPTAELARQTAVRDALATFPDLEIDSQRSVTGYRITLEVTPHRFERERYALVPTTASSRTPGSSLEARREGHQL